ncbi:MAG: methylmalonyl-CoA mutase small subunit [Bacteroidales bacterium]|nr:methylmalonyl-CoA mutase small subunit [Bacteroidales bacterium]
MANSKEKLFNEFPPVSTEQWEAVIQKDLKGADYEKKLIWKTLEGLRVKPYYRSEDLTGKEYLNALPGEFPYIRGNNVNSNEWEIRQDILVSDPKSANENALFILERGVTSIGFDVYCKKDQCIIKTQTDISALLKDIYIDCIGVYFLSGHNSLEVIKMLSDEVQSRKLDKTRITGAVSFDPLGCLTINGAWGKDEKSDFETIKSILEFAENNLPNYRVLSVNGQHFSNAGASVVQELGFTLSMAAEYLTRLSNMGVSVTTLAKHLQVNLGVGTNYFMEIAKVRAARFLFAKLLEAYKSEQKTVHINSHTSQWHNTVYDPYVNVLRATTEAMSAVIGGTNSLVVKPFDKSFKKPNQFSDRIARNIQIILKEESYFDKIVDPSAGSYYIENLTDSIISEAWKLFLDIDSKGGYLQALKDGIVQKAIGESAVQGSNNIATRREILLGTNQYPNFNESILKQIDESVLASESVEIDGNVVTPIRQFRGAAEFEKLRLATEKSGQWPKVFMLTIGNLAFRKARATFSCNFFACAGYEVVDNLGFKTAEEGVKAALDAKSDIIVVCSSDDEYATIVPEVNDALKDKAILVVAGAPACMDELKAKGISNFIHVKSNVLETLKDFHLKLGIKI